MLLKQSQVNFLFTHRVEWSSKEIVVGSGTFESDCWLGDLNVYVLKHTFQILLLYQQNSHNNGVIL